VGDLGGAFYFEQAFRSPVGTVLGPINVEGQTVFCRVLDKTEVDLSGLASTRDQMVEDLKMEKARTRKMLLDDGIVTRMIEEGDIKINESAIDSLVNAYQPM